MRLIDSHTHHLRRNAIVNIDPVELRLHRLSRHYATARTYSELQPYALRPGYTYSVGIHPWNCLIATDKDLLMLRAMAAEPGVAAIGETGLDTMRTDHPSAQSGLLKVQIQLLGIHACLSEELRKPLILHVVKRFNEIIRLRKELHPSQPWIIHGFRGKPELARELLRHGFYLSYGEKFNPASVAITPTSRLLVESDESHMPLSVIARRLSAARISTETGEFSALDG
ncbi:MAG: TatD family hydrolase [Duncaniella sp.]|nr:TatD family hydrolase [Duncaniella sp.]